MEGKTFSKLTKDCKFFDKKFSATDVDIIFAKAKSKSERRLTFA
jgi:p25-alpha